jgi:hypothetical protein
MVSESAATLSDVDLGNAMALMAESDSVELKLTVDEADRWSTITSLELDPLDAQMRQVFFFDTPDLALDKAGVVVRARRVQGKGDDSIVKLRPVVPSDMPADLRTSSDFVVEVDAVPGGYVCSGSLKAKHPAGTVQPSATGERPLRKAFSKAQRAFYRAHAPEGIDLDSLVTLGPINVMKIKYAPEGFSRRLAVELWVYPDGSRILELSTRCAVNEPFQVAAEAKAFLAERGVILGSGQTTKTRAALSYFSKQLAEANS